MADGRPAAVIREADLSVNIGRLIMPFTFFVLQNLNCDLILRMDFLLKNKAKIDLDDKIITFHKGLSVASINKGNSQVLNLLRTIDNVFLPPKSETILPVKLPYRYKKQLSICEPLSMTNGQKFIAARSAVQPLTDLINCKVLNPTNEVIRIQKNKAILSIQPIDSEQVETVNREGSTEDVNKLSMEEIDAKLTEIGLNYECPEITES